VARVPSAAHKLAVAHVPLGTCVLAPLCVPAASIAMANLRAELNRHHDDEDSRITIERQHERRRNIEGRNLEGEFDSLAPV
jgi:hypothetical protein